MCRAAAPDLVQVYSKYKDRHVAFVSLTGDSRKGVTAFTKKFSIPWASGYEARPAVLAHFKTIKLGRDFSGRGLLTLVPTLYLTKPDGTVLWNDGRARYAHKNPKALAA